MRFVLGSASPARLRTLRQAGVEPDVIVSGVDEDALTAPTPVELVQVLADAKAAAVARDVDGEAVVLGCDSMLEFEDDILGKPATADEAIARWRAMRGNSGVLHTGHCLVRLPDGPTARAVSSTVVRFADITDDEIEEYVATGEPMQVAGAFTVDGLGGWYVEGIDGDHHNVVGLSLPLLRQLLHQVGLTVADIRPNQGASSKN